MAGPGDDESEDLGFGMDEFLDDYLACRTIAYAKLLWILSDVKDPKLKAEGMQMLESVRRSFKIRPAGEVKEVKKIAVETSQ